MTGYPNYLEPPLSHVATPFFQKPYLSHVLFPKNEKRKQHLFFGPKPEFTGSILLVYIILAAKNPIAKILDLLFCLLEKYQKMFTTTIDMSALGRVDPSKFLPNCPTHVFGFDLYRRATT